MAIYMYVLELEDETSRQDQFRRSLDEFLDIYSFYLNTRIQSVKEAAVSKAFQLHLQNPEFTFVF